MRLSRRARSVAFLVTAVAVTGAVTLLILLSIPISQEPSGYSLIGARLYSFESENVFGPHFSNFTYRSVTFEFEVWCTTPSLAGAGLCGQATGSDGAAHSYSFWEAGGPPGTGAGSWQTWIAPDAGVAVQYHEGGLVHLLVAV